MTKQILTDNYGIVTITDVMVDIDGTNLEEGVDITNDNGELLAEVAGICADDITDGDDAEMYIDNFNEEE